MASTFQGSTKAKTKHSWLRSNLEVIFGWLIVGIWTLIRLFNHAPNFDQLGQQVLAHQWLLGMHSGVVIGPTNYLLKMFFLYTPFDSLPLPAQFKLVFMTLLVNILTFVLLVYSLKQIWLEFYPKIKYSYYWPLIYLALISGSVYWISFTNSRNLEVAGGVFLILLYIRTQNQPSVRNYSLLVILGTFLFFSDPLQQYMTLLPVLIFIFLRWAIWRNRKELTVVVNLFCCAIISTLLAHLLLKTIENVWNVSFIEAPRQIGFSASSLKTSAEQITKLYGGGYEGGHPREALNLLVVLAGTLGMAFYAWRKPKSRQIVTLITTVLIIDLGIYIISGQAQQLDTNRYLIMTVPMLILALVLTLYYLPATRLRNYTVAFILIFNSLTLALAFARAWNPSFSNNNHNRAVINYLGNNHFGYGYASIGTAISSDYLSNWKVAVLTLGCEPDFTLKGTNLFFDKSAFAIANRENESIVPIILDGNTIKINQAACGPEQIQKQLGSAQKIDHLGDGSTVLLYKSTQLQKLGTN